MPPSSSQMHSYTKQAGAELCQAQVKLTVEVDIVAEVGIQLLVRVVGDWWVDGLKQK